MKISKYLTAFSIKSLTFRKAMFKNTTLLLLAVLPLLKGVLFLYKLIQFSSSYRWSENKISK